MRKHLAFFTAASLVISGWAYSQQEQRPGEPGQIDRQPAAQPQPGIGDVGDRIGAEARLPSGTIRATEQQTEEIQQAVVKAAEAALHAENFDQLLEQLSQADRQRLQQDLAQADRQQFDQQISQLRQSFQQQFDRELELSAEQVFDPQVQVVQAEVVAPAILVRFPVEPGDQQRERIERPEMQEQRPQPGMQDQTEPGAAQPGARNGDQPGGLGAQPGQPAHQPGHTGADRPEQPGARIDIGDRARPADGVAEREHGLEAGDQIALVTFPQRDDLQRVTVSLVQEENEWKLNIPDQVDAQTLQRNLSQQFRQLQTALQREGQGRQPEQLGQPGQQDRQPGQLEQQAGMDDRDKADKAQAKVVHAVMLALYDVDAQRQPGQQPMQPQIQRPAEPQEQPQPQRRY